MVERCSWLTAMKGYIKKERVTTVQAPCEPKSSWWANHPALLFSYIVLWFETFHNICCYFYKIYTMLLNVINLKKNVMCNMLCPMRSSLKLLPYG